MGRRKRSGGKKGKISVNDLPEVQRNVAGIDIGSREHWVCGPRLDDGTVNVSTFGTTTPELSAITDWLLEQDVQSVAMESTSVYWIPLYELLESRGIEVILVNGRHLKSVPGRKSDMHDCQWLQLLHSHGLVRGSFRPKESICALRALWRHHGNLVEERSKAVQWMQKALDQMNVQVHHAVSDITGVTGMKIIRAIVAGDRDPEQLARHRDRRCRKSIEEMAAHLTGTWRSEHLLNLESALSLYDHLQQQIVGYEKAVLKHLKALQPPDRKDDVPPSLQSGRKEKTLRLKGEQDLRDDLYRFADVDLLRIDGIGVGAAQTILTEVGPDLAAFPSENHFVSWLRLAPYTPNSGGKRLNKSRKAMGSTRIAGVLRNAALSLKHSKTALGAAFRRASRLKGMGVAVFSLARRLAILVYRMLRYGQDYVDEGERAYDARFEARRLHGLEAAAASFGLQLVAAE